jgi:hypothetical protein
MVPGMNHPQPPHIILEVAERHKLYEKIIPPSRARYFFSDPALRGNKVIR